MNALTLKLAGLALSATIASIGGGLLALGAPAAAATPIVVQAAPSATVSHADLNLGSIAGVERLNDRVRRTAEQLCVENTVKPLRQLIAERECLAGTLAKAAPQVGLAIESQRGIGTSAGSR